MSTRPADSVVRFLIGSAVGLAFFIGGYYWCVNDRTAYGWVMFLMVPFISGFLIATIVGRPALISLACFLAGFITMIILVGTQWEGYICVAMAAPFLAVGMLLGAFLGHMLRDEFLSRPDRRGGISLLLIVACPFLLAAADRIERPFRETNRFETFSSQIFIPQDRAAIWKRLLAFETMSGPQPFLLRIGLPTPHRCTLDKEAVGGRRVCYFNQGIIAQEVTEWQEPEVMKLRVAENTLPGRRWLTFIEAGYDLTPVEGGTLVVRRTTISSRLYPRWYWRMFEEWGVCSEHEYVLSNLANPVRAE